MKNNYLGKRIIVIGSPGAGKSTLANKLGRILEIPLIHIDKMFWRSGWKHIKREELASNLEKIYEKEKWIIDGNYVGTLEKRMKSADVIIYLDFPNYICLFNAAKRVFLNWNKTRNDMREGCPEIPDMEFVKYIWNFSRDVKPRMINDFKQFRGDIKLLKFTNRSEVNEFLFSLLK